MKRGRIKNKQWKTACLQNDRTRAPPDRGTVRTKQRFRTVWVQRTAKWKRLWADHAKSRMRHAIMQKDAEAECVPVQSGFC